MKNIRAWRIAACALCVCSVLGQATQSFGQTGQPEWGVAPQRGIDAPAELRLRPSGAGWTASTPINPDAIRAHVEQQELARAQTASRAVLSAAIAPAPKQVSKAPALDFTPAYSAFLPVALNEARGLYGYVTQNGLSAASVSVILRFYDGVANSTVATTTTDANGMYSFRGRPALARGQQYWIRYNNDAGTNDRLSVWITQFITTYVAESDYAFAAFDIADVTLGTPAPYAVIAPPAAFSWTPRAATPSDSYEMQIFDPTGVNTNFYTSGQLGYVGTTNVAAVPTGMSLLVPYGWMLGVYSPDGGFGTSRYYSPVMFGKAGIQGRVTLNGANIANITVQLMLYNGTSSSLKATTTTGSDGIYQFTTAASLTSGQQYYARYSNSSIASRLWAWYTALVPVYTAGERAYAGNFDIANVPLVAPRSGNLYAPYTFSWTIRPNTPTDHYVVEVFGNGYSPYASVDSAGYVGSLSMNSIPAGLTTGTTYYWDVLADSPDGGWGQAFQTYSVIFR